MMEAIPHNIIMQTAATIGGDDMMMDSEYEQVAPHDDDYDIDLDAGETFSNTGDEEMKFDEEVTTYDNDDLMLDEVDYSAVAPQEEMIITEATQTEAATFSNVEMGTLEIPEVEVTESTETQALIDSIVDIPQHHEEQHAFTQETQRETLADSYIHSQADFGHTAEGAPAATEEELPQSESVLVEQSNEQPEQSAQTQHSAQVEPQGQTEQTEHIDQTETAGQKVQAEAHSEAEVQAEAEPVTATNISHTQAAAEGAVADIEYPETASTEVAQEQLDQHGQNTDSNTQQYAGEQSDDSKIHPIIVQFESNTLSLFNSIHYVNYTTLDDNSENPYPEVPSVFLLPDASFYSKGFDELFGALRELFGATIGDDAEITMDFMELELFLHEDNLLTKSISLSDLINLHLRLFKQDGVDRPDPLYIVLSTQPRFTKRYSELLTAAGEGKGFSQVSTYSPTNDYPGSVDANGNAINSPEGEVVPADQVVEESATADAPAHPVVAPTESEQYTDAEAGVPFQETEGTENTALDNNQKEAANIEALDIAAEGEDEEYIEDDEDELLPAEDEPQYAANDDVGNVDDHTADVIGNPVEEANEPEEANQSEDRETHTEEDNGPEPVHNTSEQLNDEYPASDEYTGAENTEANEQETVEDNEGNRKITATLVEGLVNNAEEELLEYEEEEEAEEPAGEEEPSSDFYHPTKTQAEIDADDPSGQEDEDFPDEMPLEEYPELEANEEEDSPEEVQQEEFTEDDAQEDEHEDGEVQDHLSHESPETTHSNHTDDQYSPTGPIENVDNESFSSATVVEANEAQSPINQSTHSPEDHADAANDDGAEEPAQQKIQVHQFDDENSEAGDIDAPAEDENGYTLGGEGEQYPYEDGEWEQNVNEILESNTEYYQDGYVDGEYVDETTLAEYGVGDEFTETNDGQFDLNNGNSVDDTSYADAEGYDENAYAEFPQEVTDFLEVPGGRSPHGKRLREDETDLLQIQDTKRTRSQ